MGSNHGNRVRSQPRVTGLYARRLLHLLNLALPRSAARLQFLPATGELDLKMRGLVKQNEATQIGDFLRNQRAKFVLIYRPYLRSRQSRRPAEIPRNLHGDMRPVSRRKKDGIGQLDRFLRTHAARRSEPGHDHGRRSGRHVVIRIRVVVEVVGKNKFGVRRVNFFHLHTREAALYGRGIPHRSLRAFFNDLVLRRARQHEHHQDQQARHE
jgi:hypothetical protein